jgi:O-antigen/teichoic acid export membrane protein
MSLLTITLASVLYRPKFWIFRLSLTHWRAVFGFGGIASATAVLNNFYLVLPQALLGRLAGFDAAGLYSRAVTLCQLPDRAVVGAFQPVIFPAFAAEVRAGGNLKAGYLHALTLLAAVQWPVLICLAIMAEPAVGIVLGPQWHAAAPVLRILCIAYLGMTPAPLTYPTLVALGRVRDTLAASLITLPIGIVGIVATAPLGLMAVAASMLLSWPLQVIVSLVFIRRQLGFAWRNLLAALAHSLPACIGAGLVPLLVATGYGFSPDLPWSALVLAVAGAVIGWLLGLHFSHNPLMAELRQILSHLGARLARRAPLAADR